jgi:hypothetical protein
MVLASFVKEFWPHLYAASSFTRQPVASAGYTKAAPPGRGAWLDEHVMEALFGAQQEAQTVSALAAQSAEIVVACAKFVENGNGRKEELKQYWYGKPTKDTEGACRKAVRLAAESAEKMKGLAVRLEWVLGEKWWATLTSTERGMWTKTSIGEGAKTSTGESVADGTATATKMATETLTAWW